MRTQITGPARKKLVGIILKRQTRVAFEEQRQEALERQENVCPFLDNEYSG